MIGITLNQSVEALRLLTFRVLKRLRAAHIQANERLGCSLT